MGTFYDQVLAADAAKCRQAAGAAWEQESLDSLEARMKAAEHEAFRLDGAARSAGRQAQIIRMQYAHAVQTGGRISPEEAVARWPRVEVR